VLADEAARYGGCSTVQSRTSKKVSPMCGVWSGKRDSSAADHALDDAVLVDVARPDVEGLDRLAVADDRDESAMAAISLSLWLIMMQVIPCGAGRSMRSSRCWSPLR
jgi:hypothetical protein